MRRKMGDVSCMIRAGLQSHSDAKVNAFILALALCAKWFLYASSNEVFHLYILHLEEARIFTLEHIFMLGAFFSLGKLSVRRSKCGYFEKPLNVIDIIYVYNIATKRDVFNV